jgi:hypothetical protein
MKMALFLDLHREVAAPGVPALDFKGSLSGGLQCGVYLQYVPNLVDAEFSERPISENQVRKM